MKKFAALFALLLAAFALVACGGGDDTTSDSTTETPTTQEESGGKEGEKEAEGGTAGSASVDFEADPSGALAYTADSATAQAGKVTVNFTNSSPVPHDVAIEDSSGEEIAKTEVLAEGNDSTTAELEPGEYTFYCSVPGHRQGGMEGTLTVK
ncbi:MAG TPA: plastocyanin/azurin family copper-binding protein [Solirubrobacterales bacterium]